MKLFDESLVVGKDRGIANVVIWLRSRNVPQLQHPQPVDEARTFVWKDGKLEPRVLILRSSQKLRAENRDPVAISVRLQTWRSDGFQVMLPSKGHYLHRSTIEPHTLPIRFDSPNNPNWLKGWVVVRDDPYAAVTGTDGTFRIETLPPGEWEFQVWHERMGYVRAWPKGRFTRKIEPGRNDLGSIKLSADHLTEGA